MGTSMSRIAAALIATASLTEASAYALRRCLLRLPMRLIKGKRYENINWEKSLKHRAL